MRSIILTVNIVILLGMESSVQDQNKRFSDLSRPEKCWVIRHPFKARKALDATVKTLHITDSVKQVGLIGSDMNGGKLDAFKHTYWMAELSRSVGERAALSLGKAHEKGNYRDFSKGNAEDGSLPDKASSDMDHFNNVAGARIFRNHPGLSDKELVETILDALNEGELRLIRKENNNFLSCEGEPLDLNIYRGKWDNGKCLVPSDAF